MNSFDIRIESVGKGFKLADDTKYYTTQLSFDLCNILTSGISLINDFSEVGEFIKWGIKEYNRYWKKQHHDSFDRMQYPERERLVVDAAFNRLSGLKPRASKSCEVWI